MHECANHEAEIRELQRQREDLADAVEDLLTYDCFSIEDRAFALGALLAAGRMGSKATAPEAPANESV